MTSSKYELIKELNPVIFSDEGQDDSVQINDFSNFYSKPLEKMVESR
jgi:hypothetical protein